MFSEFLKMQTNKHNEKQRNSTVTVMAEKKRFFNKRFLGFWVLWFLGF